MRHEGAGEKTFSGIIFGEDDELPLHRVLLLVAKRSGKKSHQAENGGLSHPPHSHERVNTARLLLLLLFFALVLLLLLRRDGRENVVLFAEGRQETRKVLPWVGDLLQVSCGESNGQLHHPQEMPQSVSDHRWLRKLMQILYKTSI